MMANGVCTVIGAGPGMGMAVARRFAREGFGIALLARKADTLQDGVREVQRGGTQAQAFAVDVADADTLRATLASVQTALGAPNVLVYNVAMSVGDMPSTLAAADLERSLVANVVGALVATQAVLPAMREQGRGTILFTGGGLALNPYAGATALGIGKAAIRHLTFDLAGELEPLGVHVATVTVFGQIAPGTHFDPDVIAEEYWRLHSQPRANWQTEFQSR